MSDLKRWNFEDGGEGVVLCCKDHHEKGAPCEYEPLTAQDATRLTGCIARQDVEITRLQAENEALRRQLAMRSRCIGAGNGCTCSRCLDFERQSEGGDKSC